MNGFAYTVRVGLLFNTRMVGEFGRGTASEYQGKSLSNLLHCLAFCLLAMLKFAGSCLNGTAWTALYWIVRQKW